MTPKTNEYAQAVRILRDLLERGRHLDESARNSAGNDTRKKVSPLAAQIAHGVVRDYFSLGEALDRRLDKPLPAKHLDLRLLMLAGLYSVEALRRPAHASVDSAVNATLALKKGWAKGLVNAVLRNHLRHQEQRQRQATLPGISEEARLNHPQWLIDRIRRAWPDRPSIFANNNRQAPLTLRVNQARISRDDYLAELARRGLGASAGELSPVALALLEPMPAADIPGFGEGLVSIQDEGAQLAAPLLDPTDGMSVLDACAAPGGKTCHLLERWPNLNLASLDASPRRVTGIHENLARLGLSCRVLAQPLEHLDEQGFDRVLLDAPCSATGVIRRHPDIKLLRTQADIDKLRTRQQALLNKAFELLGPGGELLYSTCSILPEENDALVSDFLAKTPGARRLPIALPDPPAAPCASDVGQPPDSAAMTLTPTGLQLFPTRAAHDGFFYARIGKARA